MYFAGLAHFGARIFHETSETCPTLKAEACKTARAPKAAAMREIEPCVSARSGSLALRSSYLYTRTHNTSKLRVFTPARAVGMRKHTEKAQNTSNTGNVHAVLLRVHYQRTRRIEAAKCESAACRCVHVRTHVASPPSGALFAWNAAKAEEGSTISNAPAWRFKKAATASSVSASNGLHTL